MSEITSQLPTTLPPVALPPRASPPVERRLRLWPGVVIVAIEWALILVPAWVAPATLTQFLLMFWGPIVAAVALVVWWLFASRLRWTDRLLGVLVCAAAGISAMLLSHPSMAMGFLMFSLKWVTTAWVGWLLLTPFLSWPIRRWGLVVVLLLVWSYFPLLRFDGVDGSMNATLPWRWSPTAEEKYLAESRSEAAAADAEVLTLGAGDWPGFRGPKRDGRLTGVRLATDWKQNAPRLLWRHRIGPGWSSFTVVGTRLYTQEQRGEDEAVVCYHTDTGKELWSHLDRARFTEVVAGPGPRATPTFHAGKIYAQGAAGRLNCLDAATGKVQWSRDIVADSRAKVPQWGFAGSPLVVEGVVDMVWVFAGGPHGNSVLGYLAADGGQTWMAGEGELSYCSPQLARLGGVDQVLIVTDAGLMSIDPMLGHVLWQHKWPAAKMARVVQPAVLDDTDVLIGTGFSIGTRRLHVDHVGDDWSNQEVWTTKAIKPYYNDLVIYQDHLYGFDGNYLTCVNLKDGAGRWRARGYGNGQVLLLADQGLLLVLSEKGEVALVEAKPEAHKELGRFQALEGKTWNHPVVAHGKLFVRNGEEMACYELTNSKEVAAGK